MRLRILFHKTEAMRFTGHLDLHKTWERTFRRAGLPLAYTQGFHPQPRLNLASALPLGFTSECEILDAWLETDKPVGIIQDDLQAAAPPGIRISELALVDLNLPSLQTQVESSEYFITFLDRIDDFDERLSALLETNELMRQRHGKSYNLRPLIEMVEVLPADSQGFSKVRIQLATRDSATGRPDEFASALGIDPFSIRAHRTRIILKASNQESI